MAVHNILTVFDPTNLEDGGTFEHPIGVDWAVSDWDKHAFMVASSPTTPNTKMPMTGNGISELVIPVNPGDEICWYFTTNTEGARDFPDNSVNMIVYQMLQTKDWPYDEMGALTGSSRNFGYAFFTGNLDTASGEPVIAAEDYTNTLWTSNVRSLERSTLVPYYIIAAKVETISQDKVNVLGWYKIPAILNIVPWIDIKGHTEQNI